MTAGRQNLPDAKSNGRQAKLRKALDHSASLHSGPEFWGHLRAGGVSQ